MSRFIFALGIAVALLAITFAEEELYSDKYDDIDAKSILENETLRVQYYKCFYGSDKCPTDASEFFRSHLREAIVTKCSKCTEKQKDYLNIMSTWYTENSPKEWNDLIAKLIGHEEKPSSK